MLKITPAPANSAARAGYVCLLALFSTLAARAELPYPGLVIDLTAGLVIAWHGRYGKTMLWLSLPLDSERLQQPGSAVVAGAATQGA